MEGYPFTQCAYSLACGTGSAEAQAWIDRAMVWTFGFHREDGVSCFLKALEADPDCALAHWGVAYCHGPNYNLNGDRYVGLSRKESGYPSFPTAHRHVSLALAAVEQQAAATDPASSKVLALVRALAARYPSPQIAQAANGDGNDVLVANAALDRINHAFVAACREASAAFPTDADFAWLLAEALMNCRPWGLWDVTTGEQAPETPELVETLRRGLELDPSHPGLCHCAIHTYEMSPTPGACLPQCDVLRSCSEDCGHLLHMPSHIDVLVGGYSQAVTANALAIEADLKSIEHGIGGVAILGFTAHNHHMLVYAAMLSGREADARAYAAALQRHLPTSRLLLPLAAEGAEAHCALELHVLMRFGRWEELLRWETPPSPDDRPGLYCATTTQAHFARGVAYAVLGEVSQAEEEQRLFRQCVAEGQEGRGELASRRVHNNMVLRLLSIAEALLEGEILYRRGEHDAAFAQLRTGAALEDSLAYDEPWGWMTPVRHALGALLLEQGRVGEAAEVYREDLAPGRHPKNIWALHGLHACLLQQEQGQGAAEAGDGGKALAAMAAELHAARQDADFLIQASCACARAAWEEQPAAASSSGSCCGGAKSPASAAL